MSKWRSLQGPIMHDSPTIPERSEIERALLLRFKADDYEAFMAIYQRLHQPITARLLQLLKSSYLVEEILQEIFLRLWSNRKQIDPERSIKSYVHKIAENLVIDLYRKAARDQRLKEELMNAAKYQQHSWDDGRWKTLDAEAIEFALQQLPARPRQIFTLCKLEGKRYSEVAEELGISEASVNKYMSTANRLLRQFLLSDRGNQVLLTLGIVEAICSQ